MAPGRPSECNLTPWQPVRMRDPNAAVPTAEEIRLGYMKLGRHRPVAFVAVATRNSCVEREFRPPRHMTSNLWLLKKIRTIVASEYFRPAPSCSAGQLHHSRPACIDGNCPSGNDHQIALSTHPSRQERWPTWSQGTPIVTR